MKYLKTYEEKNIFSEIIKKYIVIESTREDIPAYILKIEAINTDLFYSKFYYMEDDNLIKRENKEDSGIIRLSNANQTISNIILQTDNFEEAVEILKLSSTTKKYNI